jgi:hypothetical protein
MSRLNSSGYSRVGMWAQSGSARSSESAMRSCAVRAQAARTTRSFSLWMISTGALGS